MMGAMLVTNKNNSIGKLQVLKREVLGIILALDKISALAKLNALIFRQKNE